MTTTPPVLDVSGLQTVFNTRKGDVFAVHSVSFTLQKGELLGIVGESGSGKSVAMMSLIGLLADNADIRQGSVLFEGTDLLQADDDQLRSVRGGKIGFIFQDPMTSLNPTFTVGYQLCEPLKKHMNMDRRQARLRAAYLLDLVGIPDAKRRLDDYPHQFSGGMRQRVMIAMALSCDPQILIADEPTTALDVTIQAQILDLIKTLRQQLEMAIIWITHDLGVIAGIADRVMVMYGGQVVEIAPVRELYESPLHPYTKALLSTIPSLRGERTARLHAIKGHPPSPGGKLKACPFRHRCDQVKPRCHEANPALTDIGEQRKVACFMHAPGYA